MPAPRRDRYRSPAPPPAAAGAAEPHRRQQRRRRLFVMLVVLAIAAGCGDAPAEGRRPAPAERPASTATTCVSAPATTAAGLRGGGEVVCSTVPQDAPPRSGPTTTGP